MKTSSLQTNLRKRKRIFSLFVPQKKKSNSFQTKDLPNIETGKETKDYTFNQLWGMAMGVKHD